MEGKNMIGGSASAQNLKAADRYGFGGEIGGIKRVFDIRSSTFSTLLGQLGNEDLLILAQALNRSAPIDDPRFTSAHLEQDDQNKGNLLFICKGREVVRAHSVMLKRILPNLVASLEEDEQYIRKKRVTCCCKGKCTNVEKPGQSEPTQDDDFLFPILVKGISARVIQLFLELINKGVSWMTRDETSQLKSLLHFLNIEELSVQVAINKRTTNMMAQDQLVHVTTSTTSIVKDDADAESEVAPRSNTVAIFPSFGDNMNIQGSSSSPSENSTCSHQLSQPPSILPPLPQQTHNLAQGNQVAKRRFLSLPNNSQGASCPETTGIFPSPTTITRFSPPAETDPNEEIISSAERTSNNALAPNKQTPPPPPPPKVSPAAQLSSEQYNNNVLAPMKKLTPVPPPLKTPPPPSPGAQPSPEEANNNASARPTKKLTPAAPASSKTPPPPPSPKILPTAQPSSVVDETSSGQQPSRTNEENPTSETASTNRRTKLKRSATRRTIQSYDGVKKHKSRRSFSSNAKEEAIKDLKDGMSYDDAVIKYKSHNFDKKTLKRWLKQDTKEKEESTPNSEYNDEEYYSDDSDDNESTGESVPSPIPNFIPLQSTYKMVSADGSHSVSFPNAHLHLTGEMKKLYPKPSSVSPHSTSQK